MTLEFRRAQKSDLPTLVLMLADDELGKERECVDTPLHVNYLSAFEEIDNDPNNELIVALLNNEIVGMQQLTFIGYLTHTGTRRCVIEGVRVLKHLRGQGIGRHMVSWAINTAKEKGCSLIQLTSNKQRTRAINFYKTMGFVASHEGLKRPLT